MPFIELAAIERKIAETQAEIQSLSQCSDENMRTILTSELQYRLNALQEQKAEIEEASSKETVSLRIYGDKVQSGKVSGRILLSALGGFQSMLDSVANAMLHSPTSRGKIPGHIRDITSFEVVGTFAGSFGLVLERQTSQCGIDSGNTKISRVMNEMFGVLETLDNSEQLLSAIMPYGKRTVTHYRDWLDKLRESDVNLEIDWKNDSAHTRKIHMMKDIAPSIITTLDTIDRIENEEVTLHGRLDGINVRNHSFEMSVEGLGIVRGTALPETLMATVDRIGTEITANMIKSNSLTKAGIQKVSWYMSDGAKP